MTAAEQRPIRPLFDGPQNFPFQGLIGFRQFISIYRNRAGEYLPMIVDQKSLKALPPTAGDDIFYQVFKAQDDCQPTQYLAVFIEQIRYQRYCLIKKIDFRSLSLYRLIFSTSYRPAQQPAEQR